MLGHIQSGNIFIVDDVCQLGGYENTLLGYKTRLYMRCKDHLEQLDTILFGKLTRLARPNRQKLMYSLNYFIFSGHLIFEMAAGYELTQLRPGMGEIKTVSKAVRPVLEFIFQEGFPHNISNVTTCWC